MAVAPFPVAQDGRKSYPVRTLPVSTVDFIRVSAHHRSLRGGSRRMRGTLIKLTRLAYFFAAFSSLLFPAPFSFGFRSGVGKISRNILGASTVSQYGSYAGPYDREAMLPTVGGSFAEEETASMTRTAGWPMLEVIQFAYSLGNFAGLAVCQ